VPNGLTKKYLMDSQRKGYLEFYLDPGRILRIMGKINSLHDIKRYSRGLPVILKLLTRNLRKRHIKRFFESLARQIVVRNPQLTMTPRLVFSPLNTKDETFRAGLLQLKKIGELSSETLASYYSRNSDVENLRIQTEIENGTKALHDVNVPVSFVQNTVDPTGETKTTKVDNGQQQGRPINVTEPVSRKPKQ